MSLQMPPTEVIYYSSAAAALFFTLLIAMPLFGRNKFPVDGRNIVVTGGSQGMGKAAATLLASRGANVVIVARDVKKLEAALVEIRAAAKSDQQKFHYISADLTSYEHSASAISEAETQFGSPIDVLWCCAGAAVPGLFLEQDPTNIANQVTQNYYSSAYPCHAALKSMVKNINNPNPKYPQKIPRKVVLTSSLVHFAPIVGYASYAASKYALRGLTDCLRQEMLMYGEDKISVSCCFPGTITSPGLDKENEVKHEITKILEESDEKQSPEEVAKACVKQLEKGELLITSSFTGFAARAPMWGMVPKADFWLQTVAAGVIGFVWPFIRWDMDGKVRKYRKKNGVPVHNNL